jgi:hypothetical protein
MTDGITLQQSQQKVRLPVSSTTQKDQNSTQPSRTAILPNNKKSNIKFIMEEMDLLNHSLQHSMERPLKTTS